MNSPLHGQRQYKDWIYGEGRPHLSFDNLRETAVLIPPLDEQHEIVKRVELLFRMAAGVDDRVTASASGIERMTRVTLAKAFRGELVPTEAELARLEGRDYEPASALLERIRREGSLNSPLRQAATKTVVRGKYRVPRPRPKRRLPADQRRSLL